LISSRLTPRTRFGSYEILAVLGEGGMGAVYRAHDTKLNRDVAIKVLLPEVGENLERLARFRREAQVLAALNHQHIGHIFGLEEGPDGPFLVLELVDGPTLAERIARGPIADHEALPIARQIADALEAAHEQGIIHRDLKPSNIKVRDNDGIVKVLDFGLAKAVESDPAGPPGGLTQSPTITSPAMTRAGIILGTAAYMAPEQARGHVCDKRVDIWAFGCVLMEMITGRAVFERPGVTETLAAVLEREPDWSNLPATTPAGVQRLLRRCLEKEPKRRLRDIGDARIELDLPDDSAASATVAPRSSSRLPWIVALAAATLIPVAVLATLALERRRTSPAQAIEPLRQLTLATADEGVTAEPVLSNDGVLLAYTSDRAGNGNLDVWVQQAVGSTPLQLTRDPLDEHEPDFSPDGSRVAYRIERDAGAIYTIPAFGGQEPRLLVEGGRRPRYSPDGRSIAFWTGSAIGFVPEPGAYRTFVVPANGGPAQEVKGFTGSRFPAWAPDGQTLLLLGSRATRPTPDTYDWWRVRLDGGEPTPLAVGPLLKAAGVPFDQGNIGPGDWRGDRVLFAADDFLWSVHVNARSNAVSNPQRLTFGTNRDASPRSSASGTIAFASISTRNSVWTLPIDMVRGAATGEPRRMSGGAGFDSRPSASRDGQAFAYHVVAPRESLLLRNVHTNAIRDLGVAGTGFGPALSPDGMWIAFEDGEGMSVISAQGGSPRSLCNPCRIGAWFADSRAMVVVKQENNAGRLAVVGPDQAARDLVISADQPVNRPFPSPDGRLLAFRRSTPTSNSILIAPLKPDGPSPQESWRSVVAPEADARPCGWSPDGGLLYFLSARDGVRCLYAQRVNRATGAPDGEAVAVRHFHGGRRVLDAGANVLSTGPGNAIAGGYFWYDLSDLSANVWTMR